MAEVPKYDLEAIAAELTEENLQSAENMLWVPRLFQIGAVIGALVATIMLLPEAIDPNNYEAQEWGLIGAYAFAAFVFFQGRAIINSTKKRLDVIRKHRIS